MTRKEMRDLEEAEVEFALRREVSEAQQWNESQRRSAHVAIRAHTARTSGIAASGALVEPVMRTGAEAIA